MTLSISIAASLSPRWPNNAGPNTLNVATRIELVLPGHPSADGSTEDDDNFIRLPKGKQLPVSTNITDDDAGKYNNNIDCEKYLDEQLKILLFPLSVNDFSMHLDAN